MLYSSKIRKGRRGASTRLLTAVKISKFVEYIDLWVLELVISKCAQLEVPCERDLKKKKNWVFKVYVNEGLEKVKHRLAPLPCFFEVCLRKGSSMVFIELHIIKTGVAQYLLNFLKEMRAMCYFRT